jgi:hypothetical protein
VRPDGIRSAGANPADAAAVDDGEVEEGKKSDCIDETQPDNVPSIDANQSEDEIPEGEYPTADQLNKILAFLDSTNGVDSSSGTTSSNNASSCHRDMVVKKLRLLHTWSVCPPNEEDAGVQKTASFIKTFLELGGLLRMKFFLEKHMDDVKCVVGACAIIGNSCCCNWSNGHENDWLVGLRASSSVIFARHDGFRVLQLACEELLPSSNNSHWSAANLVWDSTRRILLSMKKGSVGVDTLMVIVEADLRHLVGPNTQFLKKRLSIMGKFASILSLLLSWHREHVTTVCRRKEIPSTILDFILTHKEEWSKSQQESKKIGPITDIIAFCARIVNLDVISPSDFHKWLPLVTRALSVQFVNKNLANVVHILIKKIAETTEKRELIKTDLCNTILAVVQADTAPLETKSKYQKLLAEIVS